MQIKKIPKEDFPKQLLEIPQPPKDLWILGEIPKENLIYLCVVGSRKYTSYGKEICEKLISSLSGYPVVIVSGFSIGMDTIAHKTALENNIKTIVFPGSGLSTDCIYPRSNIKMVDEIIQKGGCFISEFEPNFKATQWSFPMRNRLMAGMSKAILVIEAEEKSGTLITARLATEYNKDVFSVPGSVFSQNSKGTNFLIKQGATPITKEEDLLDALGFQEDKNKTKQKSLFEDLSEEEKSIIKLLREPKSKDELVRELKMPIQQLSTILTILEIKGLIKEEYGEIRICF